MAEIDEDLIPVIEVIQDIMMEQIHIKKGYKLDLDVGKMSVKEFQVRAMILSQLFPEQAPEEIDESNPLISTG